MTYVAVLVKAANPLKLARSVVPKGLFAQWNQQTIASDDVKAHHRLTLRSEAHLLEMSGTNSTGP